MYIYITLSLSADAFALVLATDDHTDLPEGKSLRVRDFVIVHSAIHNNSFPLKKNVGGHTR